MGSCIALNARQRRFVEEYAAGRSATQAAIAAGYSARSAYSQAHDLLKRPQVRAELARLQAELAERARVRAEDVVARLAALAFASLADYMRWGPSGLDLVDSTELSETQRAAVESLRVTKSGFVIKLRDPTKPLELLGKHLGLFGERVEVDLGLGEVFEQVRRLAVERAAAGEEGEEGS